MRLMKKENPKKHLSVNRECAQCGKREKAQQTVNKNVLTTQFR